jgi:hypothetical protein
MTYSEFIAKYNGKGVDYDGVAGVQCVDLAKLYLHDVFGINPGAWGDAHCYYDNFNNIPALKNNFIRIANTADFVPKQGDIVVWSSSLSKGGWGHIAIATGEGDTTYFYSYDQNWTGKHDKCTKVRHTYKCLLGVLRAKGKSTSTSNSQSKSNYGSATTTTALNYRTAPNGSKVGTLASGTKVYFADNSKTAKDGYTWRKILLNGKNYYVADKYLK